METLNTQSPIPLYHQLADIILAKIRSGEYPPGSRIPSEHALAGMFGIGRPTVRQATDLLVRRGVLERKRGAGTFVREREKEIDLFSLAGTTSAFRKKDVSVETMILHKTSLADAGTDPDNPFSGKTAWFFSRLSLAGGVPVLLEDIYMEPEVFPDIDLIDLSGRSLSRVVRERYYMEPAGGRQTFRIGRTDGERAKLLDLPPDEPILAVKRHIHFKQRKNAIYSELFCRTDRFVFSQNLGGTTYG